MANDYNSSHTGPQIDALEAQINDLQNRIAALEANGLLNFKIGYAYNTDYNNLTTSGIYRINNGFSNGPGPEWGQLLVMHGGGDTVTQIYGDYGSSKLYTRSGNPSQVGGSGNWRSWLTLST